jgi:hypothetical protein
MDELLPAASLRGMENPLAWVQHIETRLAVRPPCAPSSWVTIQDCLAALQWHQPLGRELVTVFLMVQADRVEISIWSTAWSDDQVSCRMYTELVTTVATLIMDQYADQDGPLVRLQVQPYDATQAPLKDIDDGGHAR